MVLSSQLCTCLAHRVSDPMFLVLWGFFFALVFFDAFGLLYIIRSRMRPNRQSALL